MNRSKLDELSALIEPGQLRPHIGAVYSLAGISLADSAGTSQQRPAWTNGDYRRAGAMIYEIALRLGLHDALTPSDMPLRGRSPAQSPMATVAICSHKALRRPMFSA